MTNEQKQEKMGAAVQEASDIILKAFVDCEIQNDIEAQVVDKDTGKMYQINFILVKTPTND